MPRRSEPYGILEDQLARYLHEAGRPAVAEGNSMSGSRQFIEWDDLPEKVQQGRVLAAKHLKSVFHIRRPKKKPGAAFYKKGFDLRLATQLHKADKIPVEQGLVLNKVEGPYLGWDQIPKEARTGRIQQAKALMDVLAIRERSPPVDLPVKLY